MKCPICGDNLDQHDTYKLEMCCLAKLIAENTLLIEENKQLKEFIEGNEFDLTPEFRKQFPNGI
jgi:hypothetical protein